MSESINDKKVKGKRGLIVIEKRAPSPAAFRRNSFSMAIVCYRIKLMKHYKISATLKNNFSFIQTKNFENNKIDKEARPNAEARH